MALPSIPVGGGTGLGDRIGVTPAHPRIPEDGREDDRVRTVRTPALRLQGNHKPLKARRRGAFQVVRDLRRQDRECPV